MDIENEKLFWRDHLTRQILPFWESLSFDSKTGSFFTCFSNTGDRLASTDKYTWSQGRMLWAVSRLSTKSWLEEPRRMRFLHQAEQTYAFLRKYCLTDRGTCAFVMDRYGRHKPARGGADTSIYADCFVVLGVCEYAKVSKNPEAFRFALDLYQSVIGRVRRNDYRTQPYPVPRGYRTHGIPMILTNTSRAVADMQAALGVPVTADPGEFMAEVLDHFIDSNGTLREMVPLAGGFDDHTLLGRYINPGHTIEDAWFMLDETNKSGDARRKSQIVQAVSNAFRLGWDEPCSGLLLFADCEGGQPKGATEKMEREPMVSKVTSDWSSKLWWPHSEALYTLLRLAVSGLQPCGALYRQLKDYVLRTFPDPEHGEWVQILDRAGRPDSRIVALPVKDPFHIIRNLLLITEL